MPYTIKWNCTLLGKKIATEIILDLHCPIPTKEAYKGSNNTNKYILGISLMVNIKEGALSPKTDI